MIQNKNSSYIYNCPSEQEASGDGETAAEFFGYTQERLDLLDRLKVVK